MMTNSKYSEVLSSVLQLPHNQQIDLLADLNQRLFPNINQSPSGQWEADWLPMLEKRLAESQAGRPGIPAEEVFAEIDEELPRDNRG